jgi:hypothetical protein
MEICEGTLATGKRCTYRAKHQLGKYLYCNFHNKEATKICPGQQCGRRFASNMFGCYAHHMSWPSFAGWCQAFFTTNPQYAPARSEYAFLEDIRQKISGAEKDDDSDTSSTDSETTQCDATVRANGTVRQCKGPRNIVFDGRVYCAATHGHGTPITLCKCRRRIFAGNVTECWKCAIPSRLITVTLEELLTACCTDIEKHRSIPQQGDAAVARPATADNRVYPAAKLDLTRWVVQDTSVTSRSPSPRGKAPDADRIPSQSQPSPVLRSGDDKAALQTEDHQTAFRKRVEARKLELKASASASEKRALEAKERAERTVARANSRTRSVDPKPQVADGDSEKPNEAGAEGPTRPIVEIDKSTVPVRDLPEKTAKWTVVRDEKAVGGWRSVSTSIPMDGLMSPTGAQATHRTYPHNPERTGAWRTRSPASVGQWDARKAVNGAESGAKWTAVPQTASGTQPDNAKKWGTWSTRSPAGQYVAPAKVTDNTDADNAKKWGAWSTHSPDSQRPAPAKTTDSADADAAKGLGTWHACSSDGSWGAPQLTGEPRSSWGPRPIHKSIDEARSQSPSHTRPEGKPWEMSGPPAGTTSQFVWRSWSVQEAPRAVSSARVKSPVRNVPDEDSTDDWEDLGKQSVRAGPWGVPVIDREKVPITWDEAGSKREEASNGQDARTEEIRQRIASLRSSRMIK